MTDQSGPDHERVHREEIYAKKELSLLLYRLQNLPGESRGRMQGRVTQELLEASMTVETPRGPLSFVLLGSAGGRAITLLTKQPATIEWINGFEPNSVFWDIGANVGVYGLYAALRGDTRVVAIEPAAVNYFLLSANCEVNKFEDRMQCLLVGLGRCRSVAQLEVSQFAGAQSFSFLGKEQPYDGRQSVLILSIDQLVEDYGVPCPNYIKIDVPGLSEDVIAGGQQTLLRPELRSIHIELTSSRAGKRIAAMLERHGFVAGPRDEHGGSGDVTFSRSSTASASTRP
jgi:FkbM family methyltransferase